MPPVFANTAGFSPQTIDDPRLLELLSTLNSLKLPDSTEKVALAGNDTSGSEHGALNGQTPPVDIVQLSKELEKCTPWRFEEQADLLEWAHPLNLIDASLAYLIKSYPFLLLIGPVDDGKYDNKSKKTSRQAESSEDTASVPPHVIECMCKLLRFLSSLLRNSTNKNAFNSVYEVTNLLAAADDIIASLALDVLSNLAIPPMMHKQQTTDSNQSNTMLHSANPWVHARILSLARGWGSQGSGLGLFACVTADDSEYGQGRLPSHAGEVDFEFYSCPNMKSDTGPMIEDGPHEKSAQLINICLSRDDIVMNCGQVKNQIIESEAPKEQEKPSFQKASVQTKSTSQLFYNCVQQAGGRHRIPRERQFTMLADIRLAKGFHSRSARIETIETRLKALIAMLHAHPSHDIMSGYFLAQPELCTELVDLIRPTVSSASVSESTILPWRRVVDSTTTDSQDAGYTTIGALASSPIIPYCLRSLAIESLTALVARRDGTNGGLTTVAKQANVLAELGVGKGQYLGILPTLLRYSLASLNSFLSPDKTLHSDDKTKESTGQESAPGVELGMAFVEATKPSSLPKEEQLERALEFIDTVLTLTSAVVSVPSGTPALTECGLIPALVTTIAMGAPDENREYLTRTSRLSSLDDTSYSSVLLKFITAQSIQIVEGAVLAHNNALSAFHDLHGVDVLVERLHAEVQAVCCAETTAQSLSTENAMDVETENDKTKCDTLRTAKRILLFSLINCLTVVFHQQESTSSSPNIPSSGSQLRKDKFTKSLKEILTNVSTYGGVLAALTSTLLGDIMNSDPQVVHHVHESGLGKAFLAMLMGESAQSSREVSVQCKLPPVPDLLMALPSVISALSLTEDGLAAVKKADPFPYVLSIFCQPDYVMPRSRCLLTETSAFVGTGLDELMRHVPSLRPLVINAIVATLQRVVNIGEQLVEEEAAMYSESGKDDTPNSAESLETKRTCLIQYALNCGQLLEQIVHNEDHALPFAEAGGLEMILEMYPILLPSYCQFLSHISALSCPSISNLTHSTTEGALSIIFKSVLLHCDPHKIIKIILSAVRERVDVLEKQQRHLLSFPSCVSPDTKLRELSASKAPVGVLDVVPRCSLHELSPSPELMGPLSEFLRNVVYFQWLTNLLVSVIRTSTQRSIEAGGMFGGRIDREWKKELCSEAFIDCFTSLSNFNNSSILEACRIRTEDGYEDRHRSRLQQAEIRPLFRLRIVCQEGAIVRDGIEIDTCSSVGTLEMGEIVDATDRCVNSSEILRYCTPRGWVSEQTRGHGREPIAEVICLTKHHDQSDSSLPQEDQVDSDTKRIELGIADLCSASASVLARLQTSQTALLSSLSQVVVQGVKCASALTLSNPAMKLTSSTLNFLSKSLYSAFAVGTTNRHVCELLNISKVAKSRDETQLNAAGAALYLGCLCAQLHISLHEEKRERRNLNIVLLLKLLQLDGHKISSLASHEKTPIVLGPAEKPSGGLIVAIQFVFKYSLSSMAETFSPISLESKPAAIAESTDPTSLRRVGRPVAGSLPTVVGLLRCLTSRNLFVESPLSTSLSRMSSKDLKELLVENAGEKLDLTFRPDLFANSVSFLVSDVMLKVWQNALWPSAPAHVFHPIAQLVTEIISSLETASSSGERSARSRGSGADVSQGSEHGPRSRLDFFQRLSRSMGSSRVTAAWPASNGSSFEASEDAISRLVEMGFSRDHALNAIESTSSNRLEVAMEYALSHPPPSPQTVERQRLAREQRRQERAATHVSEQESSSAAGTDGPDEVVDESTNNVVGSSDGNESRSTRTKPASSEDGTASPERSEVKPTVKSEQAEKARLHLTLWKKCFVGKSIETICENGQIHAAASEYVSVLAGAGSAETPVVVSVLLAFCERYPEEQSRALAALLTAMEKCISVDRESAKIQISESQEGKFAAICHAACIFIRALPRHRTLALQKNLVNLLVSCAETHVMTSDFAVSQTDDFSSLNDSKMWPLWLTPVLLFIDVMVQPVAFDIVDSEENASADKKGEYALVCEEHKIQRELLSRTAEELFSVRSGHVSRPESTHSAAEKQGPASASKRQRTNVSSESKACIGEKKEDPASVGSAAFAKIPPYLPLITSHGAEQCLILCLKLLERSGEGERTASKPPPPNMIHSILILITRLCRSQKLASLCLRMGGAELVCSLSHKSRFHGNAGLVTVFLRRLLEDESTLQNTMETEIRCALSKLQKKQGQVSGNGVSSRSFIEATTPLICRNPIIFLRAVASSVKFVQTSGEEEVKVILLSADERVGITQILGEKAKQRGTSCAVTHTITKNNSKKARRGRSLESSKSPKSQVLGKSKSPHRSGPSKRLSTAKRARRERSDGVKAACDTKTAYISLNGSPSNHVTVLLVSSLMMIMQQQGESETSQFGINKTDEASTFLSVVDFLEITADLVLSIPACAAAIHRYRPPTSKSGIRHPFLDLKHALEGCADPGRTLVNFLLHRLLPQDRFSAANQKNESSLPVPKTRGISSGVKKPSYTRTRLAQATARLLVSLVARAGEGRRRVIADMSFALNGGDHMSPPKNVRSSRGNEIHALHVWAELCLGLAAPRSSTLNQVNNSSLSFEVLATMVEFNMPKSLLNALERIDLHHPAAPMTCAALLQPIEVFTRSAVVRTLQGMSEKESQKKEDKSARSALPMLSLERGPTVGPSQRGEAAFADDPMLEDGFDADTAARNTLRNARRENFHDAMQDIIQVEDSGMDFEEPVAMETYDSGNEDMPILDEGNSSSEESGVDTVDEDSEVSEDDNESDGSSEESSEGSSGMETDHDSEDDDSSENEAMSEDLEAGEVNDLFGEDEGEAEWGEEVDVFDGDENNNETLASGGLPALETETEEGWTRIDSTGFGQMILGARQGSSNSTGRARSGVFMDAAEAMIGTLLRRGEIPGEALSDIEGALGFVFDSENGSWNPPSNSRNNARPPMDTTAPQVRDMIAMAPQIRQRTAPEIGHTRWGEITAMEYVFAGPAMISGNPNYDVPIQNPREENTNLDEPTVFDTNLFPGGPAASTHSRSPQSVHPMLDNIEIPPFNAMVSDFPQVEATRRGRERRSSNWGSGSLLSASFFPGQGGGPALLRINRGQTNPLIDFRSNISTSRNGLVGWTDDGQPLDRTAGLFSVAFERALTEAMVSQSNESASSTMESAAAPSDETPSNATTNATVNDSQTVRQEQSGEEMAATNSSDRTARDESGQDGDNVSPGVAGDGSEPSDSTEDPVNNSTHEENTSEGEQVASSLAAGLRLSSGEEEGGIQVQPHEGQAAHNETTPLASVTTEPDTRVDESETEGNRMQEDVTVAVSTTGALSNGSDPTGADRPMADSTHGTDVARESAVAATRSVQLDSTNEPNVNGFVCPSGMDLEVFNSLPVEMQREVVEQHRATTELAAQLGSSSQIDPEAFAALPEDMRREIIQQEQQERERLEREQAPADPSNAEEMDNASFVASLAPDLREEILLTADDTFLNSLPPNIIAEAQILRERASSHQRRMHDEASNLHRRRESGAERMQHGSRSIGGNAVSASGTSTRRRQRPGRMKLDCDRPNVFLTPPNSKEIRVMTISKAEALIKLMFLLSPVRPQRLLQKVFHNMCSNAEFRTIFLRTFVYLLCNDYQNGRLSLTDLPSEETTKKYEHDDNLSTIPAFPPLHLIGTTPEVFDTQVLDPTVAMFRRRQGSTCAAAIAANLPTGARSSSSGSTLPPVVARRIIDSLLFLSKNSPRVSLDLMSNRIISDTNGTKIACVEKLFDLLEAPLYSKSSTNLEQLLNLIEASLVLVQRDTDVDKDSSQADDDTAASGKEFVEVPRIAVLPRRIHLLCSALRLESCKDNSFAKVSAIAKRLCRVEANREFILREFASVAQALGADAIRELKALQIRMDDAVKMHQDKLKLDVQDGAGALTSAAPISSSVRPPLSLARGSVPSSAVTLSTSSSELKLLRVLQTLQSLCGDDDAAGKKSEGITVVSPELLPLLQNLNLDFLWDQLTNCLHVVQVLEGVASFDESNDNGQQDETADDVDDEGSESNAQGQQILQNSVAGLLTRFLPIIEAFFVINSSSTGESLSRGTDEKEPGALTEPPGGSETKSEVQDPEDNSQQSRLPATELDSLIGGKRLVAFVAANKVLLNALIRNDPGLLDKGLRAFVHVSQCRPFLDFDVKRQWFKTQIRRSRQQVSRRHGSLRLSIRRRHVFEDAYHQLRLRNSDELRGRLHITFRDEEGVDAGGLSREFFGILAKEIFNPNYALFTSTEDGCTFQPNPNSSINPDHLTYFRFVGRIVGKAVADGFLLDAHFTRSLYKHILGLKPTHHDMEAIDPDYYKNLKMILEYNLTDIGLDLTFSIEDYSFGRCQIIDLIANGRTIPVTEATKAEYVRLVCHHRMTTAIKNQIQNFLDGFYELVKPDLVAIFTPKELELLISGMPDIDVGDLKRNTDYHGYKETDKEIEWLWNILFSLTRTQKAAFLQFVTGSSKVPLAGFAELPGMRGVQKFSIHKAGGPVGALMSAHTCFNSLDLPSYKSEVEMREKLMYAISEGGGGFLFA